MIGTKHLFHVLRIRSYGSELKASATYASVPGDIHDTVQKLWLAEEETHHLLEKEVGLLILQTNESPIGMADIILDRKTVTSLCLLYTSMRWLANKVDQLRHITTHDVDSSRRNTMHASHNRRWTLLNGATKSGDGNNAVYLPMTQETVV